MLDIPVKRCPLTPLHDTRLPEYVIQRLLTQLHMARTKLISSVCLPNVNSEFSALTIDLLAVCTYNVNYVLNRNKNKLNNSSAPTVQRKGIMLYYLVTLLRFN